MAEGLSMVGGLIVFVLIWKDSRSCLFSLIGSVVAVFAVGFIVQAVGAGGILIGILGVMAVWWLFSHI